MKVSVAFCCAGEIACFASFLRSYKYYEYDGDQEINNKGLTIGGYESAWLADLVAAYVLEFYTRLIH